MNSLINRTTLLVFLFLAKAIFSDVPIRYEQFIYSVLAFDGRDYTGTFLGEHSDTVYLMANTDNFISPRKTFVYFWPITNEWKVDNSILNIPLTGSLKISNKVVSRDILQTNYTYYNVQGTYAVNWNVAQGKTAEKIWEEYKQLVDNYMHSVQEHQQTLHVFEKIIV